MYNRRARHLQVILDKCLFVYDVNVIWRYENGRNTIRIQIRGMEFRSGFHLASLGTLVHPVLLSCHVQVSERFASTHQQLPLVARHGEETKRVTAVEAPQRGSRIVTRRSASSHPGFAIFRGFGTGFGANLGSEDLPSGGCGARAEFGCRKQGPASKVP